MKYVLDAWGFPKFVDEVAKEYGKPLRQVPMERSEPSTAEDHATPDLRSFHVAWASS